MRWLAALLVVWVGVPALAAPSDAERAIARTVKRAEQAGYERHRLEKYLAAFTEDATWVIGRFEDPEPHDFVIDRAARIEQLKRRWLSSERKGGRLMFVKEKVQVTGDTATLEAEVKQVFFGGDDLWARIYTLKKTGDQWRVQRVREWPLKENVGGTFISWTDQQYEEVEQSLRDVNKNADAGFTERFVALIRARRLKEAHALAEKTTAAEDTHGAWLALANVAFELGKIEQAEVAAKKAARLDPTAEPAFFMAKPEPSPKKKGAKRAPRR